MKKTMSAAFLVAALALTSACGGGSGGDDDSSRPTKSEIKKAITSKDSVFGTAIPAESADCVAAALVDSDVSDKTLDAIVESDKDYEGTKADAKALEGLTADFAKCVTPASGATPTPEATATPTQ